MAGGWTLPAATDPVWTDPEVPPYEALEVLAAAARPLIAPPRGRLATTAGAPLREAVTAVAELRASGTDWHVLLSSPRSVFGGPRHTAAQDLWDLLELTWTRYIRPALPAPAAPAAVPAPAPAPAERVGTSRPGAATTPEGPASAPTPAPARAAGVKSRRKSTRSTSDAPAAPVPADAAAAPASAVSVAGEMSGSAPAASAAVRGRASAATSAAPAGPAAPGTGNRAPAAAVPSTAAPAAPAAAPRGPGPAAASDTAPARAGVAAGLVLPPPGDGFWAAVPARFRNNARTAAHTLVTPPRGPLAGPEGRPLRAAVTALARGRTVTGTHWHALLTAPREAFGGPTSARATALYTLLQDTAEQHLRPALTGQQPGQDAPPKTPAHPAAPAPTPGPASPPAASAASSVPTSVEGPAAPAPATAPDPIPAPAPAPPPGSVVAGPGTLHEARAELPRLLRAAEAGTTTALSTGPHHAHLTSPKTAAAAGWNLEAAPAHGVADARKHLGHLVQEAAAGAPQVLRRHSTPVAVLLPTTPIPASRGTTPATDTGAGTGPDSAAPEPSAAPTPATAGTAPAKPKRSKPPAHPTSHTEQLPDGLPSGAAGRPAPVSTAPGIAPASGPAGLLEEAAAPYGAPAAAGPAGLLEATASQGTAPAADAPGPGPVPAAAGGPVPDPTRVPEAAVPAAPALASAPALVPGVVVAGPGTLHEARAALPQLVRAAGEGTATVLATRGDRAVLTSPAAATVLGWDLNAAPGYSTVQGRKHLGELIAHAAAGRPQVLRRHSTPVAVLLPAGPDGAPTPAPGTAPPPAVETTSAGPAPAPAAPATPVPAPAAPPVAGSAAAPGTADTTTASAPAPALPAPPAAWAAAAVDERTAITPAPVPAPAATTTTALPAANTTAPAAPAPATTAPATTAPAPAPPTPTPTAPAAAVPAERADAPPPGAVPPSARPAAGPAAPAATTPAPPAPTTPPTPSLRPAPRRLSSFADVLNTVLTPTADPATTPNTGAALGIRTLDDLLGPLQPGRLYLVTAAPGVGGSLLATAAARTTALDRNLPVLYAASGLTAADVTARIVAAHLPVDYRRLRAGRLTDAERDDARILYGHLAAAPLFLDDGAGLTADAIDATAAELPDLALVVVDRLQTAPDPRLPLSGPTQVADAAQALTHLARTRHVPVLAVLDSPPPATPSPAGGQATGLAADVQLLLTTDGTPQPTWVHATATERDLGTLGEAVLYADLAHARLLDPPARPAPNAFPPNPSTPTPTPTPATPGHAPTPARTTSGRTPVHTPNTPAAPSPSPSSPTPETGTAPTAPTAPGAWPEVTRPGTAQRPPTTPAPPTAPPSAPTGPTTDLANPGPEDPEEYPGHTLQPPNTPNTAPGTGRAPDRAAQPPTKTSPTPRQAPSRPASASASAPGTGEGKYGGRDYSDFTKMITRAVDRTLAEHDGDVDAAITALEKRAIPDAMALFEATRVGSTYEHTAFPELPDILRKKTRNGADEVWEGRHKWSNAALLDELEAGTRPPATVAVLDTNAAYLSALKTHLPIGKLIHDPGGGFNPKRAGVYLLNSRPTWDHPHLPDPIGNRRESGPVILTDPTIRLLIRCATLKLCEAPVIAENWTSGGTEILFEKFRRVLTLAREDAIRGGDTAAEAYIKAMYAKLVSTIGESSANREMRRSEYMHSFRSQAFANLWYKAHRAHTQGLTVVSLRGTDELHVTGGDWRQVFNEGRLTQEMKLKEQYTLPRSAA
ncbi:type II toxin-antitoxin system prevent-host-death family antitoxin [Streptodolium elevatio]|uniref:Type II toxin-antitoxin system prevent-host-death family antitoxin n=1 Tax=Streptodolium elevatio TaxID=3157996 RepID=A0ABV3DST0_9ACTN